MTSDLAETAGRGIEQPHRIMLNRRMADAVHVLHHEGTRPRRAAWGLVLECPDPDGLLEAIRLYRGPQWARWALRDVAFKVQSFRDSYPWEEIR